MAKELKCAICGQIFFSTTRRPPKYCGASCKMIGRTLTNKNWHAGHANYMRDYMRDYREREREARELLAEATN